MTATPQILLPLEGRRIDRFEDYVPGPNQNVVLALQDLLGSPGACLFIQGSEGSGKSHLLNAVCNQAQDKGMEAFYLAMGQLPEAAVGGLAGLERMDVVCIDDIDGVIGQSAWEDPLFHFFNRLRSSQGRLVVSSSRALSALPFRLPDLASRLGWGLRFQLEPLNDEGKLQVLQQQAEALGIRLAPDVCSYLLSRSSRSMTSLLAKLEAIRMAALSGKRKITIALAREVLRSECDQ